MRAMTEEEDMEVAARGASEVVEILYSLCVIDDDYNGIIRNDSLFSLAGPDTFVVVVIIIIIIIDADSDAKCLIV